MVNDGTSRFKQILLLIAGAILCFPFAPLSQETELVLLLDRVSKQVTSHPKLESWKASVISVTTNMDKNWKAQKETVVKKRITVTNGERAEEILSALEKEKGATKDITQAYIKEYKERRQKAEEREKERKLKKENEDNGRHFELNEENVFPFSGEKRVNYNFAKLEDSYLDDTSVYVIESKAKIKDEKTWQGKYYISKDSYEVLKTDLSPSKNPNFVKELEIEASFQILSPNYFVLKKTKIRIYGGIFIKHFRMITEEEYSDYEIINSEKMRSHS